MIKKTLLIVLLSVGGLLLLAIVVFNMLMDNLFGESSSKKELIENYHSHQQEIAALKDYYNQLVPDSLTVRIEFKSRKEIDLSVYNENSQQALFQGWDLNVRNQEKSAVSKQALTFRETMELLHWNEDTLRHIKSALDKAHCIGIANGKPVLINFRRSGFGMYSYNLFDQPLTDNNRYNDSCRYIRFTDRVVLEYGGGAVGPQCFPGAGN